MSEISTASIITNIRGLIKDIAKSDGRNVFTYDDDNAFSLGESFVSAPTIKVYKNNVLVDDGDWSYNEDTNKVTVEFVTSGQSLTKNDTILIVFDYYAKYSDIEIRLYIQSNLTKFVQKRYKKVLYMNSSNEVVTLNGVNPTLEEGNIIALLTAIDIDPQNVTIRTPDFSISASENKSKSEQVQELFDQWLRSFGTINFMEQE